MGLYDQQMEQREKNDQDMLHDSIAGMAYAVLGKRNSAMLDDAGKVRKMAIDEILQYYGKSPVEVPEDIEEPAEQLEYILRHRELQSRRMELEKGWRRDSMGAMIAFRQEDGLPVAMIPAALGGYWYREPSTGEKVRVSRQREKDFRDEAICFYQPFTEDKTGSARVRGFIRKNILPSDIVMFVVVALLITFAGMMMPLITKVLTGEVLNKGSNLLLAGTAQFMIAVLLSTALLTAARQLISSRMEIRLSLAMEAALFMRLLQLPVRFFRDYSAGDLAQRVQRISGLGVLITDSLFGAVVTALMALLYTFQMVGFGHALALPALGVVLLTALISICSALLQIKYSRRSMEYEAKASGISFALISGIQKLRIAGAEKRAFSKWASVYAKEAEAGYDPPLFLKIDQAVIVGISLLGTILMYYIAVKTGVTPSEYLAFASAFGLMQAAYINLSGGVIAAAHIRPTMDMAEPILKAKREMGEGRSIVTDLNGNIEMAHVSFRYSDSMPDVVNDLNLKIRKGEYVAITGRTGCGKSTIFRLMLGFETPQRGVVSYDGHDIRTLDLHSLRRRIGTVIQNGSLIKGDIYSNIAATATQLSMEDAWKAAEKAGIADDIRQMPMGMYTVISEGHGGLSGGQKQRLMIARAIAAKPSILLLDEATSALDNISQKKVTEALAELKCTRIVIAHRLSTIKQCDRILVMDNGRIAESGTYEQLIEKGGIFADLVEHQQL